MLKKKVVTITPFHTKRNVYIYLPKGYSKSNKRYPVFYFYDGHNLFDDHTATYGKSWGLKDYLDEHELPIIVVGVECNHESNYRLWEYSPYDFHDEYLGDVEGKGRIYMDWLTKELKPMIDRTYRTKKGRKDTAIGGSSMGGLMSLWSVCQYNKVFSRAACLSSFVRKNTKELMDDIQVSLKDPTRIYLSYGSDEFRTKTQLAKNTAIHYDISNTLNENGAKVYMNHIVHGQHNEASWEKEIDVFFSFLFPELMEKSL